MAIERVHLGCPLWGFKDWVGVLYRSGTPARDFLAQYAGVFNAVEGNTTFYSLPDPATVLRWRDQAPESFRFCFKFPREITHEAHLEGVDAEVGAFLRRLAPLGDRLGPFMLQLPPRFGPSGLSRLASFLQRLPTEHEYAVEVRHPGLAAAGEAERRLNRLLARHGCNRVLMDTRPMRAGDSSHPSIVDAEHRKPDLPVKPVVTGRAPLVRFIGHPEARVNESWLGRWADLVAGWIREARSPFFFAHCPDNLHAPALARRFHARLSERLDVGRMPEWPAEAAGEGRQMSLL